MLKNKPPQSDPLLLSSARRLKILVACERFGRVRDAFRKLGHDAWSCDLEGIEPEGEYANYHLYGDVRWFIGNHPFYQWDMLIAFPPCTYVCGSGIHRNKNNPARQKKTREAVKFMRTLLACPIPMKAIENPVGILSTAIRKPDQIIQPYEFGEDASKKTCLWTEGLPHLCYGLRYPGRWVRTAKGKLVERWSNQTDSGQNRLPPSVDRGDLRGMTYQGIADAMAKCWG